MEGDEGKTSSLVTLTLLLAQPDLRFVKKKLLHFFIQKTRVNLWTCGLSRLPPFLAKKYCRKWFYEQIMNLIVLLFDFPSLGPVSRPDESKLQSLRFICLIASQSKYLAFLSQIFSHFTASEPALSVIFKSLKENSQIPVLVRGGVWGFTSIAAFKLDIEFIILPGCLLPTQLQRLALLPGNLINTNGNKNCRSALIQIRSETLIKTLLLLVYLGGWS